MVFTSLPVLECSDDKNLDKAQRKQAQIDSAPHKSDAASQSDVTLLLIPSKSARLISRSFPSQNTSNWPTSSRICET